MNFYCFFNFYLNLKRHKFKLIKNNSVNPGPEKRGFHTKSVSEKKHILNQNHYSKNPRKTIGLLYENQA